MAGGRGGACALALLLCLGLAPALKAQSPSASDSSNSTQRSWRLGYTRGVAIEQWGLGPTVGAEGVGSLALELAWRLRGTSGWRSEYRGPSLGLGLRHLQVDGKVDFGSPTALYGFFEWPLAESERLDLRAGMAFGFAGGWNAFDPLTNPDQSAIGSSVTALVEIAPSVGVRLSSAVALRLALVATHYSNGGLAEPNRGLTVFAPRLALDVGWPGEAGAPAESAGREASRRDGQPEASPAPDAPTDGPTPDTRPAWGWRTRLYGGAKTVRVDDPVVGARTHRAAIYGGTLALRRPLTRNVAAVLGGGVVIDATGRRASTVDASVPLEGLPLADQTSVGASLGLDWTIGRARLETAWGMTLWRHDLDHQVRRRFESLGASWLARPGLELGVMVRSSRGISDFAALGVAWVR